jgi:glutathione S-transferase
LPTFLVPLWLCALYLNDAAAAVLGLIWIGGRILYYLGYREAARKRLPGFYIQTVACLLLFIGAIAGLVMHW